ncbi:hypothetical protein [Runella sp.]|uniref:hypothetical protein n=1 Tax=Runella sp. TaxID=1960881 RepID=UPI003D0A4D6A
MKKYLLLSIFLLISNLNMAQNLKLSDLKGVWESGRYENNFYIFYEDTIASIGLNDGELDIGFTKIGFIDENDPYLIKLDSIQNIGKDKKNEPAPLYFRINLTDEDIKHIKLKNREESRSIFYFGGTLCGLGIEDYPIQTGTRMEIINSNVHIYIKRKDLPPLFIHKLSLKYPPQILKRMLDKTFMKIKIPKSLIYSKPTILSKMYLIKGDQIEVVGEKELKGTKWLNFRYYGNSATTGKTIEGWIKKADVNNF